MFQEAIGIAEIEQDLRIGYYKDRFWRFFRDAWKVLEPETPLTENWHMEFICDQLQELALRIIAREPRDKDLIINIPPATTKSTLVTILWPVWCWIHAPHLKILNMSHNESLAITHAVKSRDVIQSEWFQDLFGHIFSLKIDVNKKSEFATDKGGTRIAMGVGQNPVGKHGDIIIVDDPIDPEKAIGEAPTAKVNRWWDRSVSTRMTDAEVSTKVIVMQRLSRQDLTGHCLKKDPDRYRQICLPASMKPLGNKNNIKPIELISEYDKREGLLSPGRLSRKILEAFKTALGTIGYAGQYDQEPVAEGGTLMKSDYIHRWSMKRLEDYAYELDEDITWNVWMDGAYTSDKTNDPTGILCACRIGGKLFVRYAEQVWMELPELIKHVPEVTIINEFGEESKVIIEPKASGLSAAQMLRRYSKLNVIIDKPPRDDKVARFKACLPFAEAGRLIILDEAIGAGHYIEELMAFPFGEHDDLADCTSMAISWAQEDVESDSIIGISAI